MEPRISLVTLGVADIARARRFYEALGLTAAGPSSEHVVFFQMGGMALSLYPREALAEDARLSPAGTGFSGVTLGHNLGSREEVDAALAGAAAAGGTILKAAEDAFWGGYSGYFADPDGHVWEVAWNPHFALLDDGTILLPA